jgi:hypothetical protein
MKETKPQRKKNNPTKNNFLLSLLKLVKQSTIKKTSNKTERIKIIILLKEAISESPPTEINT